MFTSAGSSCSICSSALLLTIVLYLSSSKGSGFVTDRKFNFTDRKFNFTDRKFNLECLILAGGW